MYIETFLQSKGLDNISTVMGCHPKYLEHFNRTQNFIMRNDGPLPYAYRHLIAIMVSAVCEKFFSIDLETFPRFRRAGFNRIHKSFFFKHLCFFAIANLRDLGQEFPPRNAQFSGIRLRFIIHARGENSRLQSEAFFRRDGTKLPPITPDERPRITGSNAIANRVNETRVRFVMSHTRSPRTSPSLFREKQLMKMRKITLIVPL